jgi:hypothetical protein
MHQRGYYRCVGCQKPYVTQRQIHDRFFGALKIYLLAFEWFKSFGLSFLIGAKERVTRKRGERFHETCIQHQLHRGYEASVNAGLQIAGLQVAGLQVAGLQVAGCRIAGIARVN